MEHHEFSPSSLEQYRICPGSYIMQKGIPEHPGEWANEGSLLHKAVETRNLDGLNDEQKTAVQSCLDFLDSLAEEGDKVFQEELLNIYDPETGGTLTYGTADVLIVNVEKSKLITIDWKFGYMPVNAVNENIQLASYSLGAMQKFNTSNCDAWVFQPRIHQKSHHVFTNGAAILANIKLIIKKATGEKLILNPTEGSCRYCSARLGCPAFRVKFQKLMASRGSYDLTQESVLENLYDDTKAIKTYLSEIEAAVKDMIEKTGKCGRYIFQTTDGTREIKDLNQLYSVVKDYLTASEFNGLCKVQLGKFETALAGKLIAEAEVKGEKLTKTEAKSRCYAMIADLITRGTPIKKIVEAC